MKIKINSIADIKTAAQEFINNINGSTVFAFYGSMGAGKTTFIRAILRKFFDDEKIIVRSPTYTYYQEYSDAKRGKVFHFDLYRLDDLEKFYLIIR